MSLSVNPNDDYVQLFIVEPEINTGIKVGAAPNRVYKLMKYNDASSPVLYVFSEPSGAAVIYVHPSATMSSRGRFVLEDANGNRIRFDVRTRNGHYSAQNMLVEAENVQSPSDDNKKEIPVADIRPTLSKNQIKTLTNEQLLDKGYPSRPGVKKTPQAYKYWLKSVSKPMSVLKPICLPNPHLSCIRVESAPQTSPIWCGFEMNGNAGDYCQVSGTWVVPSVRARGGNADYSAIWTGIDDGAFVPGISGGDMIQGGTEQNCMSVRFGTVDFAIYSYYIWWQILPPTNSTQTIINNFRIKPGDEISMRLWIGNIVKPLSPSLEGTHCIFLYENLTTRQSVKVPIPVPAASGTNLPSVCGMTAEWITERPTLSISPQGIPNYASIANFSSFKIKGAFAQRNPAGANIPYHDAANLQITMTVNGINNLSEVIAPASAPSEVMGFRCTAYTM